MTATHEAVKTRHKETSLIFPVLALAVLLFWGSSQSLPVVVGINILALVGILTSAFSVVRHADVLAHRLGEPYGSLILSLSVVILEVSLISALMATGDAAPTLMRDTLYSIIMIVTGGLVGFSLLLGGRKFATQYMNLFGIKQYLIALFPLAIIVRPARPHKRTAHGRHRTARGRFPGRPPRAAREGAPPQTRYRSCRCSPPRGMRRTHPSGGDR